MLFGVFGGDQDVVDIVEYVRYIAEYFVQKALKVLPRFFLKPDGVRESRNNPNGVIMPVFFYIFFLDGDFDKYPLSCENVAEVGKAPHWVLVNCCLVVEQAVIAAKRHPPQEVDGVHVHGLTLGFQATINGEAHSPFLHTPSSHSFSISAFTTANLSRAGF